VRQCGERQGGDAERLTESLNPPPQVAAIHLLVEVQDRPRLRDGERVEPRLPAAMCRPRSISSHVFIAPSLEPAFG